MVQELGAFVAPAFGKVSPVHLVELVRARTLQTATLKTVILTATSVSVTLTTRLLPLTRLLPSTRLPTSIHHGPESERRF